MKALTFLFRLCASSAVLVCFTQSAFAADLAKGKELFQTYCSSCHGNEGAGDGPAAAALPPNMKPANMQAGTFKKVTDDASMREVLKKGGPAFGLSPLMAPQSGMSDEDLTNVIGYVRSLKK